MTPTMQMNIEHLSGITPVFDHLGVIRATGVDAASFLQSQLTQDVLHIGPDEARLAAFCSAKGRMQASFTVFRPGQPGDAHSNNTLLLVCSADLLAATVKRLSMFVMRAKVQLSDASADYELRGLAGEAASRFKDATKIIAARADKHWAKGNFDAQNGVFLPPVATVERVLWCAPVGTAAPVGPPLSLADWHWLEVQSGIATVTQPIADAFVPQMLNYESVGGVNFKKGCFPGQEIVARSQFRGTLKRRTFLLYQDSPDVAIVPFIGQEIFHSLDASQPCGTVVAVAACSGASAGFDLLASMQTAAVDASRAGEGVLWLSAGNPSETSIVSTPSPPPALQIKALPYELLNDI